MCRIRVKGFRGSRFTGLGFRGLGFLTLTAIRLHHCSEEKYAHALRVAQAFPTHSCPVDIDGRYPHALGSTTKSRLQMSSVTPDKNV